MGCSLKDGERPDFFQFNSPMIPPYEILRRAIERGRNETERGRLYSGPSFFGRRKTQATDSSQFTSSAAACMTLSVDDSATESDRRRRPTAR
jgi:hypothetical protein